MKSIQHIHFFHKNIHIQISEFGSVTNVNESYGNSIFLKSLKINCSSSEKVEKNLIPNANDKNVYGKK